MTDRGWRTLYNKNLLNFNCLPDIIKDKREEALPVFNDGLQVKLHAVSISR
jgi:hypothetical protein